MADHKTMYQGTLVSGLAIGINVTTLYILVLVLCYDGRRDYARLNAVSYPLFFLAEVSAWSALVVWLHNPNCSLVKLVSVGVMQPDYKLV